MPALLTRKLDPRAAAVLVWGAVQAGDAANAIPRDGMLRGTLRLMDPRSWDAAEGLVRDLIRNCWRRWGPGSNSSTSAGCRR